MFSRNDLCTHTRSPATKEIDSGFCDARCWRHFFQVRDFKYKQYGRETPCYGDNGTTLMVKENAREENNYNNNK